MRFIVRTSVDLAVPSTLRARARMRAGVRASACVHACGHACVRACMRAGGMGGKASVRAGGWRRPGGGGSGGGSGGERGEGWVQMSMHVSMYTPPGQKTSLFCEYRCAVPRTQPPKQPATDRRAPEHCLTCPPPMVARSLPPCVEVCWSGRRVATTQVRQQQARVHIGVRPNTSICSTGASSCAGTLTLGDGLRGFFRRRCRLGKRISIWCVR